MMIIMLKNISLSKEKNRKKKNKTKRRRRKSYIKVKLFKNFMIVAKILIVAREVLPSSSKIM